MLSREAVIVESFVLLGIIISAIVHLSHPMPEQNDKGAVLRTRAMLVLAFLAVLVIGLLLKVLSNRQ